MNCHAKLAGFAQRIWSRKGLTSTLLLPLSWLAGALIRRKQARFRRHPDLIWNSPVPVVIVGNIYVGGTGKTPVVIELALALAGLGWTPGVVSRGYGVNIGPEPRTGRAPLDPARFGDEPALIAAATQAPVSVHPSRVKAAQALLQEYPEVDIIVADDGLQHLALGRHAEIIVQDSRGTGNGRLLPAGPLREPVTRMTHVDVIITNQSGQQLDEASSDISPNTASDTSGGPVQALMTLIPQDVVHLTSGNCVPWEVWVNQYATTAVSAVAAIGHPERFFNMLRDAGLVLEQARALPDHTAYTATTFDHIKSSVILITSKDAVKCAALGDERLWAVRVSPHFSDMAWLDMLHTKLIAAAGPRGPASSRHVVQTPTQGNPRTR